jgi:hypothetical protein
VTEIPITAAARSGRTETNKVGIKPPEPEVNLSRRREGRLFGKVQKGFRKGSGKVQERFRRGSGKVQERFRKGSEKVQTGFRKSLNLEPAEPSLNLP